MSVSVSGPRRAACNYCCSVSNVGGEACWQQGWMRRVWRASTQWWSRHLKPASHLSSELVCSLLTFSLLSLCVLFCLPNSFSLSYHIFICFFFVSSYLPVSSGLHLFHIYRISFSLSACICLSLPGFLVLSISLARRHSLGHSCFHCDRLWTKLFYRSLVVL